METVIFTVIFVTGVIGLIGVLVFVGNRRKQKVSAVARQAGLWETSPEDLDLKRDVPGGK